MIIGETWKDISAGLPDDAPAHVVREDPNKKGFLFLGTETGLYYSTDDGGKWTNIKSNFPNVPVWDLKFIKQTHDLAVATHGRGIFILDNILPLEEISKQVLNSDFNLFSNLPVYNFYTWNRSGFEQSSRYTAPNPPGGAVIDYYLKDKIDSSNQKKNDKKVPVLIKITDSQGTEIDTIHGSAHKGINRVQWNLHYKSETLYAADTIGNEHPNLHNGPQVLPGKYTINVIVNGKTVSNNVIVKPDPRLPFNMKNAQTQFNAELQVYNDISGLNTMLNRIDNVHNQIENLNNSIKIVGQGNQSLKEKYKPHLKQAHEIDSLMNEIKDTVMQTKAQKGVGEDDIHYLTRLHDWLNNIRFIIGWDYNATPSLDILNELKGFEKQLNYYIGAYNNLVSTKVNEYNKAAAKEGLPILFTGPPLNIPQL